MESSESSSADAGGASDSIRSDTMSSTGWNDGRTGAQLRPSILQFTDDCHDKRAIPTSAHANLMVLARKVERKHTRRVSAKAAQPTKVIVKLASSTRRVSAKDYDRLSQAQKDALWSLAFERATE